MRTFPWPGGGVPSRNSVCELCRSLFTTASAIACDAKSSLQTVLIGNHFSRVMHQLDEQSSALREQRSTDKFFPQAVSSCFLYRGEAVRRAVPFMCLTRKFGVAARHGAFRAALKKFEPYLEGKALAIGPRRLVTRQHCPPKNSFGDDDFNE